MNFSGIIFAICALILGFMFFNGQRPAGQTLVEVQETPARGTNIRACQVDEDCIGVDEGCCGCKQGGRRTAINRKYYSHYLDQQSDACFFASCPGGDSTHSSCQGGRPSCDSGICQMS